MAKSKFKIIKLLNSPTFANKAAESSYKFNVDELFTLFKKAAGLLPPEPRRPKNKWIN